MFGIKLKHIHHFLSIALPVPVEASEEISEVEEPTKPYRKPSDTTKITQYMYDFVVYAHADLKGYNKRNPRDRKSVQDLADVINAKMGTDKSASNLGRIWNGKLNREELAEGKAYFEYK